MPLKTFMAPVNEATVLSCYKKLIFKKLQNLVALVSHRKIPALVSHQNVILQEDNHTTSWH